MSEFFEILLAATEASLSVILTLLYGVGAAKIGLISPETIKGCNGIISRVFLPLLIVTKTGPELTWDNLTHLWVILAWSVLTIGGCHLWGYAAHRLFKMPAWISPACGLVNANAYPLLMLKSLKTSGLLDRLKVGDESVDAVLNRGSSYVLLNSVIQQSIAFFFTPRLLDEDKGHETDANTLGPGGDRGLGDIEQDAEHVGLLTDYDNGASNEPVNKPIAKLDQHLQENPMPEYPTWLIKPLQKVKAVAEWLSPPVVAALIALLLGATPSLHYAFFADEGPLKTSVTESMQNLGELYVSLQAFLLGALLHVQHNKNGAYPPLAPSLFVLVTRFVLMPIVALLVVYHTAGTGFYRDDPILWLVLIIMPSGATALILSTLAQLSDVDVGPISGFLSISYVVSPLLAVTVAFAFRVIDSVQAR